MTELHALLTAANAANPNERIQLRDPIAAHGARAIPMMVEWLEDPRLGAFAVRVLAKIAQEQTHRRTVLDQLVSVDRANLSEPVARDVLEVVGRFATSRYGRVRPNQEEEREQADHWPRQLAVSPLEMRFHDAMLEIFKLAGEGTRRRRPDGTVARGYWPSYFLRAVRNHGGPEYARQLLRRQGTSPGFQRLTDEGRLDLTVEALVLNTEFAQLFTDDESRKAADRLRAAGYSPLR